jgi:DNA-binding CsgD family transcriptional regulator
MYANDELEGYICPQTRFKWQNETQLVYETKLRFLGELIAKASQSRRLNKEQIREALRRLEDFLDVLEDNRAVTKGSEDWHFTLKLWHGQHQKEANLRRFDEEWESRRPKKSRQIANQVASMDIITTQNPVLENENDVNAAQEKTISTHLWQLVLNIPFHELTPLRMAEILEVVQKISGDASLTVRKIEEGSVKIVLEGSLEGFRRINVLFREGQLTEIAGSSIKAVLIEGVPAGSVRFREDSLLSRERQLTAIAEAQEWRLTPRETEVWLLRRSGYTSIGIASQLGITINTVKKHFKNIYRKGCPIDLLLHKEIPYEVRVELSGAENFSESQTRQ